MQKRVCYLVCLMCIVVSSQGTAQPIEYTISWLASGTYTKSFSDAAFSMTLAGDKTNVISSSTATTSEGLAGVLTDPDGQTSAVSNQFLGIQSISNPSQSFIWGAFDGSNYNSIIDAYAPTSGLSAYDLSSDIGPLNLSDYTVYFDQLDQGGYTFTDASNLTFQAAGTTGTAIDYIIGWTGSGSYTNTFNNATFSVTLTGDTSNVASSGAATTSEGLAGVLTDLDGQASAVSDQYLGIQSISNPSQSFIWGAFDGSNYNSIIDASAPMSGLSTYDLASDIGPLSLTDYDVLYDHFNLGNYAFTSASNFTFEAKATTTVPEPSSLVSFCTGLLVVGLLYHRRCYCKAAGFGTKRVGTKRVRLD